MSLRRVGNKPVLTECGKSRVVWPGKTNPNKFFARCFISVISYLNNIAAH